MSLTLYAAHIVLFPLLLVGIIRRSKARLQNRSGPSVLQPFWDAWKLLRKDETISESVTGIFRLAPVVSLATTVAAAAMVPWLGVAPPLAADLFVLVYLLALGKFATGLGALDTGSSFGALGASREATIGIQVEPAVVLSLAALAVAARTSALPGLFSAPSESHLLLLVPLVATALMIAAMAELARMPFDDPTTHLELTMIHEALLLENSGRNLAIAEYAAALKLTVLLGLVAQTLLMLSPVREAWAAYVASLGLLIVGGWGIAILESSLVKLRWRRIPNFLSYALMASTLACLLVALKG